MEQTSRLFVALPLPQNIRQSLLALNSHFPGLRFSANLHLTLRFIGDTSNICAFAEALTEVVCPAFDLRVTALGHFSRGIIYAAPEANPALPLLWQKVNAALGKIGLAQETRPFTPHITLCRLKTKTPPELAALAANLRPNLHWHADKFILYRSLLKLSGAIHEHLKTYYLK